MILLGKIVIFSPIPFFLFSTDLCDVVADVAGGVTGGEQAADTHTPDSDLVPVSHQSDMAHWH